MSYQGMEISHFGFKAINEAKYLETKVLIKPKKLSILAYMICIKKMYIFNSILEEKKIRFTDVVLLRYKK